MISIALKLHVLLLVYMMSLPCCQLIVHLQLIIELCSTTTCIYTGCAVYHNDVTALSPDLHDRSRATDGQAHANAGLPGDAQPRLHYD